MNKTRGLVLKICIVILAAIAAILPLIWKKEHIAKTIIIVFALITICTLSWIDAVRETNESDKKDNNHVLELRKDSLRYIKDSIKREDQYYQQITALQYIAAKKRDSLLSIINSNYLYGNIIEKSKLFLVSGMGNRIVVNGDTYLKERRLTQKEKEEIYSKLTMLKVFYPDVKFYQINTIINNRLVQDIKVFMNQNGYESATSDGGMMAGNFQFKGIKVGYDNFMKCISISIGAIEEE